MATIATEPENLVGLYTMFYRGYTNHIISVNFRFHGNLTGARKRAQAYCNIMGFKLNFVQPMVVDLDREEKYKLGGQIDPSEITVTSLGR